MMHDTRPPLPMGFDVAVVIQNVSAKWTEEGPESLKNITINLPKGKLCAIIGSVGSGKVSNNNLLYEVTFFHVGT